MMSLFPIPTNVEKRLDKLRMTFLWHGNKEKEGFNLVRWKAVTLCKKDGGLGIRNMRKHNQSLLMKWLWRFITEENALWR